MSARRVVERYLAEVLTGAGPGSAEELISDAELRQRVERLRVAFPDLVVKPLVLVDDEDLAAAHFVGQGTHLALFRGVPPTGRTYDARCTAVYRVANGRIAEAWETWNDLSLMEQLDAVERVSTVSA
jgi:steroid delta-isomerase-like uncharacterized protein